MKKMLLSLLLLSACGDFFVTTTSSPGTATTVEATPKVDVSADTARQLRIGDICAAVANTRGTPAMRAKIMELRQQTDFTESEIRLIGKGDVAVGMSEQAGICALGGNSRTIKSVVTTTTEGHFVQEMTFNGAPSMVLTTDNYVVAGVLR